MLIYGRHGGYFAFGRIRVIAAKGVDVSGGWLEATGRQDA